MPQTQVFSISNVPVSAAPPSQILPTSSGVAIPANKTGWTMAIDLGGTIPSGQPFTIAIEYQRNQWTDANGVVHPAGEWLQDTISTFLTGTYTPFRGTPTTIYTMSSSIGATNENGMVEPYPTHARARIDQAGNWTLPSVTLTLN